MIPYHVPFLAIYVFCFFRNDRNTLPIGSMYAIYGNIYHQYTPNVSIYTIHGSYGLESNSFNRNMPRTDITDAMWRHESVPIRHSTCFRHVSLPHLATCQKELHGFAKPGRNRHNFGQKKSDVSRA